MGEPAAVTEVGTMSAAEDTETAKPCSRCGRELPPSRLGHRGGYCPRCKAEYMREYRRHRAARLDRGEPPASRRRRRTGAEEMSDEEFLALLTRRMREHNIPEGVP